MDESKKAEMRDKFLDNCRTDILAYYRKRTDNLLIAIKEVCDLPGHDSQPARDIQSQLSALFDENLLYLSALKKYYGSTFIKPKRTEEILKTVILAYKQYEKTLYDPA